MGLKEPKTPRRTGSGSAIYSVSNAGESRRACLQNLMLAPPSPPLPQPVDVITRAKVGNSVEEFGKRGKFALSHRLQEVEVSPLQHCESSLFTSDKVGD